MYIFTFNNNSKRNRENPSEFFLRKDTFEYSSISYSEITKSELKRVYFLIILKGCLKMYMYKFVFERMMDLGYVSKYDQQFFMKPSTNYHASQYQPAMEIKLAANNMNAPQSIVDRIDFNQIVNAIYESETKDKMMGLNRTSTYFINGLELKTHAIVPGRLSPFSHAHTDKSE
jgi:hypothetical protein